MRVWRWIVLLCVALTLMACGGGGTATYDVRGDWDYILSTPAGGVFDAGTITFRGRPTRGQSERLTADGLTYEGDYTVQNEQITISGHEAWEGAFLDADMITGTWEGEGVRGTWSAVRIGEE